MSCMASVHSHAWILDTTGLANGSQCVSMLHLVHMNIFFFHRLSRVGKTLGTLKCLSHLSLAHNSLTTIPPEIGTYLSNNIPISVKTFVSATCPIKSVHAGKLQLLSTLDLNNNKIASLPPQIGKCKVGRPIVTRNSHNKPPASCSACSIWTSTITYWRDSLKNCLSAR